MTQSKWLPATDCKEPTPFLVYLLHRQVPINPSIIDVVPEKDESVQRVDS